MCEVALVCYIFLIDSEINNCIVKKRKRKKSLSIYYLNLHAMSPSTEWGFLGYLASGSELGAHPPRFPRVQGFSLGCQGQCAMFNQMPGKVPIGPAPTLFHQEVLAERYKFPGKAPCHSLPGCTCCRELGQPVPQLPATPSSGCWLASHFCLG